MSEPTPAEELRAAAVRLRELDAAVPPGAGTGRWVVVSGKRSEQELAVMRLLAALRGVVEPLAQIVDMHANLHDAGKCLSYEHSLDGVCPVIALARAINHQGDL